MEALKADIKSQKIQRNPVTGNVSNVIARKQGALKAKHTNFDKAYKENERIASIVKAAQEKSDAMTSAHAKQEADQLGNLLGSVQHELNPLHRQAIEARAQTLKDLVRNVPSVTEHIIENWRYNNLLGLLEIMRVSTIPCLAASFANAVAQETNHHR